jgi:hypothetical protein
MLVNFSIIYYFSFCYIHHGEGLQRNLLSQFHMHHVALLFILHQLKIKHISLRIFVYIVVFI